MRNARVLHVASKWFVHCHQNASNDLARGFVRLHRMGGRHAYETKNAGISAAGVGHRASGRRRVGRPRGSRTNGGEFRRAAPAAATATSTCSAIPKFPFAEKRIYTPPEASVEQLIDLQGALKLERVVVRAAERLRQRQFLHGRRGAPPRRARAGRRGDRPVDDAREPAGDERRRHSRVRLNLETNTAGRFDPAAARPPRHDGRADQRSRLAHPDVHANLDHRGAQGVTWRSCRSRWCSIISAAPTRRWEQISRASTRSPT